MNSAFIFVDFRKLQTMIMGKRPIPPGEIMMILTSISGHSIALSLVGPGAKLLLFSKSLIRAASYAQYSTVSQGTERFGRAVILKLMDNGNRLFIPRDIYLLDIYVFYTLVSAVWGVLLGTRDRLGEIRSLEALHKLFEQFPGAFMGILHVPLPNRSSHQSSVQVMENSKVDAARFAPFWNRIIRNVREEDYVTNFEMKLLLMPKNSGDLQLVQWPLFLLPSKGEL
ncbi:hypothetical protein VNO80_20472 [Phaseolus coccineus]|uniref:Uncharacterized protein n=1 Tax=Phaseolus coccineus TaxID=3886 RepID=A0AAN9M1F2_PHACN